MEETERQTDNFQLSPEVTLLKRPLQVENLEMKKTLLIALSDQKRNTGSHRKGFLMLSCSILYSIILNSRD